MTEDDWLACTDPREMLDSLEGRASERKLRLLAVACCRRVWDRLAEPSLRAAVEVAERFADGEATRDELAVASDAAWDAKYRLEEADEPSDPIAAEADLAAYHAAEAAAAASCDPEVDGTDYIFRAIDATSDTAESVGHIAVVAAHPSAQVRPTEAAYQAELESGRGQARGPTAGLLRCIFGNPFRPSSIDPAWVTPTVVALARTIYINGLSTECPSWPMPSTAPAATMPTS